MGDPNVIKPGRLSLKNIKTYSVKGRKDLVKIENIIDPKKAEVPDWGGEELEELIERIITARKNKRPVVWFMGAHVIKNGLSKYIIELIERGYITHIAGNGATSIHDFELAFNGGTSEDVPTAIEDGTFGMWEETGRWMNEAIQEGARNDWGFGESLAKYIERHSEKFPYKEYCVLYQAYKNGIPATYHVAIGTDIFNQHPIVDFAAIGKTSGIDFQKFCYSISRLDRGVFLNFGSAVIGPEVFLKALSISRNLGYQTYNITTANFDLIDLGDYKKRIGYDNPHYYYRPRKNIVNRPTSRGGKGWHFCGDHKITIPNIYKKLIEKMPYVEKGIEDNV